MLTPSRRCPECGACSTLFVGKVCYGCFRASQGKLPEARIVAGAEANDPSEAEIEAEKERIRAENEAGRVGYCRPEPREPRTYPETVLEERE